MSDLSKIIAELKRLNEARPKLKWKWNEEYHYIEYEEENPDIPEGDMYGHAEGKLQVFVANHADEIIKAMEKGEKYERAYFRLEKRERDE